MTTIKCLFFLLPLLLASGAQGDPKVFRAGHFFEVEEQKKYSEKSWLIIEGSHLKKAEVFFKYITGEASLAEGYGIHMRDDDSESQLLFCSSKLKAGPIFELMPDNACWSPQVVKREIVENKKAEHRCVVRWKDSSGEIVFKRKLEEGIVTYRTEVHIDGSKHSSDRVRLFDLDGDGKLDILQHFFGRKEAGDSYKLILSSGGGDC